MAEIKEIVRIISLVDDECVRKAEERLYKQGILKDSEDSDEF